MISHLHLINMSRKQTANQLCFLIPLSLMPILCHCCVKLQQTEGMVFNMHIALKKNCVCFFQTNILKPVILNVNWIVYMFTTRIWTILPSSNTGLRKQNDVATNTRNSDAFFDFFSCHVINGPDYSNEHMNLKTTSQKWCIYISNEINRRERSSL